jgi:hypothetical protein
MNMFIWLVYSDTDNSTQTERNPAEGVSWLTPTMYVSSRKLKKLSKDMGDKLDKENGRYIFLSTSSPFLDPNLVIQHYRIPRSSGFKSERFHRPYCQRAVECLSQHDQTNAVHPSYTFSGEGPAATSYQIRFEAQCRIQRRPQAPERRLPLLFQQIMEYSSPWDVSAEEYRLDGEDLQDYVSPFH